MTIAPAIVNQVAAMLGRTPRGLEDIAVAGPAGEPVVIRVASLVEDKPFPTLFWLVDPVLCYQIDQLEAEGLIKKFQQRVDLEPDLQRGMRDDHQAYMAMRDALMRPEIRRRLQTLGFGEVLKNKGVGGIGDFTRIRCLHTWYGAHLVEPNTVGTMLDAWLRHTAEQGVG